MYDLAPATNTSPSPVLTQRWEPVSARRDPLPTKHRFLSHIPLLLAQTVVCHRPPTRYPTPRIAILHSSNINPTFPPHYHSRQRLSSTTVCSVVPDCPLPAVSAHLGRQSSTLHDLSLAVSVRHFASPLRHSSCLYPLNDSITELDTTGTCMPGVTSKHLASLDTHA